MNDRARRGPLLAAGTLLGAGLGGFLDGIVLHQILQWHNMLSNRVPPADLLAMKYNMVWDGLFHALTWTATVVGLVLLWRAGQNRSAVWSTRLFVGSLLLGWGLFNLVEGILDHQLLGLHHVRPGPSELAWDLGFLSFGALLALAGVSLIRHGRGRETPRPMHRKFEPGSAPPLGHEPPVLGE